MITAITGTLTRVLEEEVRIAVGGVEHQVLVPEFTRRQIQSKVGEEVHLHTIEYFEGNPQRGRMTPRLVGFASEPEIEFFELFCTVDGVGVRKALKAMGRSVRDIADMIARQDVERLTTLPGVSSSVAERIVAKLRKKVTRFALMVEDERAQHDSATPDVVEEAFLALLSLGHGEAEARRKIEEVLGAKGRKFKQADDVLHAIYTADVAG